ncbi:carbohydrate binding domain-containing protein [Flavivirga rizhaonensis]|nr:carbohydrate binding domain-containing protein [Flavivirga rizhaonensis]
MKKKIKLRFTVLCIKFMLAVGSVFAQNVIPLVPKNGEELTDVAVAFKVKVSTDGPYKLQVSKNSDFTGQVLTQETTIKHLYDHVYFITSQGIHNPSEKFLLEPGVWYWRVSDDNEASWSATRSLRVNNDHSPKPQPWVITPEKPLFHWRLRSLIMDNPATAAAQLKKMVPDAIKDYVVLDLGHSFLYHMTKGRDLLEYSRFFNDLGYKFTFDIGTEDRKDRVGSLAELEQVFKELPNCVGAATSELFYRYYFEEKARSTYEGALELCRKYGKMFVYADMNHVRPKWVLYTDLNWDKFKNKSYADYLIPLYKNTDPWGAYTCVSALQGMKLTGMVKNIGIWSDEWCWEKFGQPNEYNLENWHENGHDPNGTQRVYPFMQHIKQYIYGMTYGSTVFALEGNLQWSYQTGEPNDNHSRYLTPFVNAVISERIVPSQEAINENFHVIVNTEDIEREDRKFLTYLEGNIWGDFLRSTYGITDSETYNKTLETGRGTIYQSAYLEMTPNTDRYPSGIPFLPKQGVAPPIIKGTPLEVVKISDLNTQSEVNANLNVHYPVSSNQAYARKIDKSIFVYNTLENDNIKQSYNVDINHGIIESLSGNIDLMSYVIGKLRDDGETLFIQANAYVANLGLRGGRYTLPTYPSILKFKCQKKPYIESDEIAAIKKQEWDSTNNIFTVEIDHSVAGAVDFTISENVPTEPANFISNNGFELGDLSSWSNWGNITVGSNNVNNGSYSANIDGAGSLFQMVPVEPNTTYLLSAYGKVSAIGQQVLLGVKNHDAPEKTLAIKSTSYSKGSFSFTTGPNATIAQVYFYVANASDQAWGDDFELVKDTGTILSNGFSKGSYKERNIVVYPNPNSNGLLNIVQSKYDDTATVIKVFDITGRSVYTNRFINQQNIQIDLSQLNLNKGTYFIKVIGSNGSYNKSILIE